MSIRLLGTPRGRYEIFGVPVALTRSPSPSPWCSASEKKGRKREEGRLLAENISRTVRWTGHTKPPNGDSPRGAPPSSPRAQAHSCVAHPRADAPRPRGPWRAAMWRSPGRLPRRPAPGAGPSALTHARARVPTRTRVARACVLRALAAPRAACHFLGIRAKFLRSVHFFRIRAIPLNSFHFLKIRTLSRDPYISRDSCSASRFVHCLEIRASPRDSCIASRLVHRR